MNQDQVYLHDNETLYATVDDDKDDEDDVFHAQNDEEMQSEDEEEKEEEDDEEEKKEAYFDEEQEATDAALALLTPQARASAPSLATSSLHLTVAEKDIPLSFLILSDEDQMGLLNRLMSRQFQSPGNDLALISDHVLRNFHRKLVTFLADEQREDESFPQDILKHPSIVTLEAILKQRASDMKNEG